MADVVVGLAIVGVLAGVLGTSAVWGRRAADHAADTRAAVTAAESALVDLAQGRPPPAGVRVEPAGGGTAMAGHAWVRVTAVVRGRSASLVGLAEVER